jgi:hypothetical protein
MAQKGPPESSWKIAAAAVTKVFLHSLLGRPVQVNKTGVTRQHNSMDLDS